MWPLSRGSHWEGSKEQFCFQDPNKKGNSQPASIHLATYHQEGAFKEKRCHLFSKPHLDSRPGLREWGKEKKSWEAATHKGPRGEGSRDICSLTMTKKSFLECQELCQRIFFRLVSPRQVKRPGHKFKGGLEDSD